MTRLPVIALLLFALPMVGTAQSRMLDVGDATIRYDVAGDGEAVVFIHGWAQDLGIWDEQVRVFSPRYRVVRFDRRGFGQSTGHADGTADPADLLILLDSLGIRTASIVGLSAGAGVALRFAAAFPHRVDRLVLYGFGGAAIEGFPAPPPENELPNLGEIARRFGMDSLGKLILSSRLVWAPPEQRAQRDSMLAEWWRGYSGRDLLDPRPRSGRVPSPHWDRIPELHVPTLLVNGDHDLSFALVVADSLERRLPDVRRVVIRDGGHGAHFHQPEQFNRALLEFFAAVPARQEANRPR